MSIDRFNRRRFLLGAGTMLALPMLPSIMRSSRAGPSAVPKRFIFVFTANGQRPENWYPPGPASWNELSASESVREVPLQGTGGISKVLGPEFDELKPKLTLFRGLDAINRDGGGHHSTAPLTGTRKTKSVSMDQVLAQSSKFYPTPPPVRSVHMLIKQAPQPGSSTSVSNLGGVLTEIPHQTDVQASFQNLFGNFVDSVDPDAEQRAALKLTILDRVRQEYDLVRNSPKLGSEDRKRLEAHVELIQDLEARLGTKGPVCTKPGDPGSVDLGDDDNLPVATTKNIDLLVAAIKCDRTRVASLMLCPSTDLRDFSYLPGGPIGGHHELSHDVHSNNSLGPLAIANNWYAKQVADLCTKLDVEEDPTTGRTYLDNSIVYWGNEDGCNGYDAHVGHAMPVLLAGSAGGYLKTGRYIDYRELGTPILYDYNGSPAQIPTDFRGRPYNSLLISLMEAMGLSAEDYEQAGSTGFGDYSNNYQNQYSIAAGQQPLPFLAA